jgi:hypothetical protein
MIIDLVIRKLRAQDVLDQRGFLFIRIRAAKQARRARHGLSPGDRLVFLPPPLQRIWNRAAFPDYVTDMTTFYVTNS